MQTPKLVIFDWDNTLAITRYAVVESMEHVLSKYGLEEWDISKNKYRDKNKSLKDNFPNFFGDNDSKAYSKYIDYYLNNAINLVEAKKHSIELIKQLKDLNIKVVILSNKDHILLDKEVNLLFPNINFDRVFGSGDFAESKPSAIPVIEICKKFKIERNKNNVWLIGDSSQDTNCSIASNIQSFLIGDGRLMNEEDINNLEKHEVVKINFFKELIEILKS